MERKECYSLDDVLKHVPEIGMKIVSVEFDGDLISMKSQRYRLFKEKGCNCSCGIEGKFFAKERQKKNSSTWHFNLYGFREDGTEVIMTKDHIIPKSKGGGNHLLNYQTMCSDCNWKKGDKMPEEL